MSLSTISARVVQIQTLVQQLHGASASTTSSTSAFADALASGSSTSSGLPASQAATSLGDPAGLPLSLATSPSALASSAPRQGGLRALAVARGELGQAEQPPGSNDGPRIGVYRSAVSGSYAGAPWCAYFVSWAARQAGVPLGDNGQGLGSVAGITDWAQRTGRLTQTPEPGDLILFGTRHVGIVESVNADGSLTTIEGNSSNEVGRRHHAASEATGFVRL